MIQDSILTPDDIDQDPELAALAVLDTALQATRASLISLYPEIRNPNDEYHHPLIGHDTGILRTLLLLGDALRGQIGIYCQALKHQHRRERQPIAHRDF